MAQHDRDGITAFPVRVAVDLDGVVVDTLESARLVMAAATGMDPDEIADSWLYDDPFTHRDPAIAAILHTTHEFWQQERLLAEARPLPGAIEALKTLERQGRLAGYVTRRPATREYVTQWWLNGNNAPRVPLHMVGDDQADRNHVLCKADICLRIGATHLIDDSQDECERAILNGIVPLLVDHPLGRQRRTAWWKHNRTLIARDLPHAVRLIQTLR